MTLLNRAKNIATSLACKTITKTPDSSGYSVIDGKGATGQKLPVGNLASAVWEIAQERIRNNLKSMSSFYMEDLASLMLKSDYYSVLNSIEWADTRLWEIRIDNLPRPFTGLCPAINAYVSAISISVGTMSIGNTSWQYIKSQDTRRITIEFLDDVTGSMEEFLYSWMDEISGQKVRGVVPIQKAGKTIRFRKLSRGKYVTSQLELYCIPDGTLRFDNNQNARSPRSFSVDFAILGINRRRVQQKFPFRDLSLLAATASANLLRRNKLSQKLNRASKVTGKFF